MINLAESGSPSFYRGVPKESAVPALLSQYFTSLIGFIRTRIITARLRLATLPFHVVFFLVRDGTSRVWPKFFSYRLGQLSGKSFLQLQSKSRSVSEELLRKASVVSDAVCRAPASWSAADRTTAVTNLFEITGDERHLLELWTDSHFLEILTSDQFLLLREQSLGSLRRLGSYRHASELSRHTKILRDVRLDRSNGLHEETAHLSAMGHLVLLHYLLLAVDQGLVDPAKVSLVRGLYPIANEPYADWLCRRASRLGVGIRNLENSWRVTEGTLDLWPGGESYADSLQSHGLVLSEATPRQVEPDEQLAVHIRKGRELLQSLGWDQDRETVGFHVRGDQNFDRSLRNSALPNYSPAMARLLAEGYNVVILGNVTPRDAELLPHGVIELHRVAGKTDIERAHLAVWYGCEFFVGNLSGGTNPPGGFLRPTLWVDQYPLVQWRVPGRRDLFLPKLPFSLHESKFLTLEEIFSDDHRFAQTESPQLLGRAGYRLRDVSSEEIDAGVEEMQAETGRRRSYYSRLQQSVANVYERNGFSRGGMIPESFLSVWEEILPAHQLPAKS